MHLICKLPPPTSWSGLNLLGQTLERIQEMLHQNTSGDNQLDTLAPTDDNTDNTVFEVNLITHLRLDKTPLNTPTHVPSTQRLPILYPRTMPLRYYWLMPRVQPRLVCLNKASTWLAAS